MANAQLAEGFCLVVTRAAHLGGGPGRQIKCPQRLLDLRVKAPRSSVSGVAVTVTARLPSIWVTVLGASYGAHRRHVAHLHRPGPEVGDVGLLVGELPLLITEVRLLVLDLFLLVAQLALVVGDLLLLVGEFVGLRALVGGGVALLHGSLDLLIELIQGLF